MMIDAHHHCWEPARGDYGWLHPDSPLYRSYQPSDLAPLLADGGIGGSILVQAAPTAAETDYLLGLARAEEGILGVVGWIDLEAPDAVARIEARARDPLFVGIRPMLQDMADRAWIARPERAPALEAIARTGLVFDALVRADQLATVALLAERHPGLAIVLDHAGKPPFADSVAMDVWQSDVARIAAFPNVACKLSGLLTELPAGASLALVDRCIATLIELFAPDRLLWGSDWPVLTLTADYRAWLDRCLAAVAPADREAIFGGNARRIYRLRI
jgi:L-fuconolactonase